MTRLTRAERDQRIKQDPGDPKDTVYTTGRYHNRSYHDDRECVDSENGVVRERTREMAQGQLAPCMVCVLDAVDNSHNQGGISKLERILRDDKESPELGGGSA